MFVIIGNLSLLLSGPLVIFCSQTIKYYVPEGVDAWGVSLKLLMSAVLIMGALAVCAFRWLHVYILSHSKYDYYSKSELINHNLQKKDKKIGLFDSFKISNFFII